MRLVDTNVFIYAVGRPHEYKASCARLSSQLMRGEHDANVNTEVLQELIFFFWRRRRIEEGFGVFDRLLRGFPDPFAVTVREVTTARELQSHHPTIAPRDALHAAVVLEHGLEGIISADRRFDAIPGITRFDPMEF